MSFLTNGNAGGGFGQHTARLRLRPFGNEGKDLVNRDPKTGTSAEGLQISGVYSDDLTCKVEHRTATRPPQGLGIIDNAPRYDIPNVSLGGQRSIAATRRPIWAASRAAAQPPGPVPTMMTSKSYGGFMMGRSVAPSEVSSHRCLSRGMGG